MKKRHRHNRIFLALSVTKKLDHNNPATVPAVGMADAFLFLYPAMGFAVGMTDAFLFPYPSAAFAVGMTDAFLFPYPATGFAVGMADAFLFLYPPAAFAYYSKTGSVNTSIHTPCFI